MAKPNLAISTQGIERAIFVVRGQKVILDAQLAALYGTSTKTLNKAVKRNRARFPGDFMFQLSEEEFESLRFQSGTSNTRGGRRYSPYAFTEHGAIMAASVLNSQRAVLVSVLVVRTFVKLREVLTTHKELAHKMAELERRVGNHDEAIGSLVGTLRALMAAPRKRRSKKGRIGFGRENEK